MKVSITDVLNRIQLGSIQTKITLWAGFLMFIAATAVIAYAAVSLWSTAIEAAENQALLAAQSEA